MKSRKYLLLPAVVVALGCLVFALSRPHPVWAMTAHGTERKTIATVPLDAGMEAVFTLDHKTGDLTGYVLDQFSGKFFVQYRYRIAKDFPRSQGKFLMAAGSANFRQISENERFADGVIYVAEEASGQVVAYAIPWNSQLPTSAATPRRAQLVPLDYAKTRFSDE